MPAPSLHSRAIFAPHRLAPAECASLADVRAEIDRLDRTIVALLAERGAYVLAAARFKRSAAEVAAPDRVEEVVAHVAGSPPTRAACPT